MFFTYTATSIALPLILSLCEAVCGFSYPGPCSGDCTVSDPSAIRRADGIYFRFSTGNKIRTASSKSLSGPWTRLGAALPSGSKINLPGHDDLWAPDISKVGNTYYLYYAVSTFGSQDSAIGLATSNSMDTNTWTDHGATGVQSKAGDNYNAIDPNLVRAGNDYYLSYGSFWSDLWQVKMRNPPTKSASAQYPLAFDGSGTHAVEGSFVYYHGGYFYLFYSAGVCCGLDKTRPAAGQEYHVKVCRSDQVGGIYYDQKGTDCRAGGGTTVLASHDWVYAPGGQSVFYDEASKSDIMVYHYLDTRTGYKDDQKKFGWNTIRWINGWPSI